MFVTQLYIYTVYAYIILTTSISKYYVDTCMCTTQCYVLTGTYAYHECMKKNCLLQKGS